jgi:pilus assembly protein CpaB
VLSLPSRERALPLAAVALALLGLLVEHGKGAPRTVNVVVATRPIAVGRPIPPTALRLVPIAAADRTASMLASVDDVRFRQSAVSLHPGDYVTAAMLRDPDRAALRPGERAVALRLDAGSAPSLSALQPGARIDVVVSTDADVRHAARSTVIASALEVLGQPRSGEGTVVVTLRTTLRQAVALTAAQSYAHDLRVLIRAPGDVRAGGGVTIEAASLGGAGDG